MRVEGACAPFVRDGRLLLARRSPHKRFYPNCWDPIAGHAETGETPAPALVREAWEELATYWRPSRPRRWKTPRSQRSPKSRT